MFEIGSDVYSSVCEMLAEYGVDSGQLAVVIASLTLLVGGKVSVRLGSMAGGHAWHAFAGVLKWAFAKKPEPEASPALRAALEALKDETAVYEPRDRALHCSGLRVQLHANVDTVAEVLAAPQQMKNQTWVGQKVKSLLKDGEWARLNDVALDKVLEVIERDRVHANLEAARRIEDAQVVLVEDGDCKANCGCAEAGKKSK